MTDNIDTSEIRCTEPEPTHLSGSFERDVVPLRPELCRHALSFTTNPADAEDLVQDTMLKAFKGYDKLRPDTFLKAWLLAIMKNTWIDRYRASTARPTETLLGDVGEAEVIGPLQSGSAEAEALRHEIDPQVVAAFRELSEAMQVTMFHIVVEDMLCRDVAELLGLTTNTVLTRMHRSKRALRRVLEQGSALRAAHSVHCSEHAA
ncbi:MAG: sigma-70 family RNA polymerase sigma factor [Mycobacterium sp.]